MSGLYSLRPLIPLKLHLKPIQSVILSKPDICEKRVWFPGHPMNFWRWLCPMHWETKIHFPIETRFATKLETQKDRSPRRVALFQSWAQFGRRGEIFWVLFVFSPWRLRKMQSQRTKTGPPLVCDTPDWTEHVFSCPIWLETQQQAFMKLKYSDAGLLTDASPEYAMMRWLDDALGYCRAVQRAPAETHFHRTNCFIHLSLALDSLPEERSSSLIEVISGSQNMYSHRTDLMYLPFKQLQLIVNLQEARN